VSQYQIEYNIANILIDAVINQASMALKQGLSRQLLPIINQPLLIWRDSVSFRDIESHTLPSPVS
jgi:hypothetical protein